MVDRISSLDRTYITGDLSIYPSALDNFDTLYFAANNAESVLTQTISSLGSAVIVEDASKFTDAGLIRINDELIYYSIKSGNSLRGLRRGFAETNQQTHPIGSKVLCSVMSEHHNSLKDAIINLETNLGTKTNPAETSLNGILTVLESTYLAPKAKFRGFPLTGSAPLTVRFQNFSGGPPIRFMWDFGDGTTSIEDSPIHTYRQNGTYTVSLTIITSLGGQGFVAKTGYIVVSDNKNFSSFYAESVTGQSVETAGAYATVFQFVDQSGGNIAERYWVWDDGTNTSCRDADVHTATHIYESPGQYEPVLLLIFDDNTTKRITFDDRITVT